MTDVLAVDADGRPRELAASRGWRATGRLPACRSPRTSLTSATATVARLVAALEAGEVRAAEPDPAAPGGWRVNAWVKAGILLGFRIPGMRDYRDGPILAARDRVAYGVLDVLDSPGARAAAEAGAPWRVVPGGTTVRSGVHLEPGVTIMPPAYLNIGAWVGRGTMVDSHALVGSCAQVGARVHLSAAVQVGGVLEPAGARPVVVEDDAFVGGGCGLYDGVVIGRRRGARRGRHPHRPVAAHRPRRGARDPGHRRGAPGGAARGGRGARQPARRGCVGGGARRIAVPCAVIVKQRDAPRPPASRWRRRSDDPRCAPTPIRRLRAQHHPRIEAGATVAGLDPAALLRDHGSPLYVYDLDVVTAARGDAPGGPPDGGRAGLRGQGEPIAGHPAAAGGPRASAPTSRRRASWRPSPAPASTCGG